MTTPLISTILPVFVPSFPRQSNDELPREKRTTYRSGPEGGPKSNETEQPIPQIARVMAARLARILRVLDDPEVVARRVEIGRPHDCDARDVSAHDLADAEPRPTATTMLAATRRHGMRPHNAPPRGIRREARAPRAAPRGIPRVKENRSAQRIAAGACRRWAPTIARPSWRARRRASSDTSFRIRSQTGSRWSESVTSI